MRRVIERIGKLSADDGFLNFQNSMAQDFYDCLGQGYSQNDNEVVLVKRLVDAARDKKYGPIALHAAMLHGSRSYVEFNYLDKPVTKELGDMAVIGLITSGKDRLFQRTCLIQNKRRAGTGWDIDLEQLFLLKNFPPFAGNKGMFKGCRNLSFRNTSGCLGAFGLLDAPGEMMVLAASLISDRLGGKKSLSHSDLSHAVESRQAQGDSGAWGWHFGSLFMRFHPDDWHFLMEVFLPRSGFPPFIFSGSGGHSFLGNAHVCRDIYDFVRCWTQFSLGEITCVQNTVTNRAVDAFSNRLIQAAGFGGIAAFPDDNVLADLRIEGRLAVLVSHLNVEAEG